MLLTKMRVEIHEEYRRKGKNTRAADRLMLRRLATYKYTWFGEPETYLKANHTLLLDLLHDLHNILVRQLMLLTHNLRIMFH